jgi:hypothetical protein
MYDRSALKAERGPWRSGEFVTEWADDDVLADALALPREISAAIVADAGTPVKHIIDLGSGPGAYLEAMLRAFPDAHGTWVDSSEPMQAVARERLAVFAERVSYVSGGVEQLGTLELEPAQVVVTSRMLHDVAPNSASRFYEDVYELVEPGGFFFNLDHFAGAEGWEARYRRIRAHFTSRRRQPLPPHRDHPLPELDDHLRRLETAGFEDPAVPWRLFSTALVAARRPG